MNTIPGSTISCSGICLIKSLAYSLTRTPAGFSMYQSYHGAPASHKRVYCFVIGQYCFDRITDGFDIFF